MPTVQPNDTRVNKRRESRIAADTPVMLTVLRILGEPMVSGLVNNVSGSGLSVDVRVPIPCGAQVRVESADLVMLGEVCRCEPFADGYSVALVLSEIGTPATSTD